MPKTIAANRLSREPIFLLRGRVGSVWSPWKDIHEAKQIDGYILGEGSAGEVGEFKRGVFSKLDRLEVGESRVTSADTSVKIGTCHKIFATASLEPTRIFDFFPLDFSPRRAVNFSM